MADTNKRKTKPPFPVQSGMGERGLAYVIIKNHEARTPWGGDTFGVMRWRTVDQIIDLRAHGLTERDVIRRVREYVRYWFESGLSPKPFGNPAVRELAHTTDQYPIRGKARFVEILNGRGYPREIAADMIADAVRGGLIRARRTKDGVEYRLAHEPRTRAVCDLLERVMAMMPRYPFGISSRTMRKAAGVIAGGGMMRGITLIERALNAGVIRAEDRGGERFYFPNFKTKGGKSC